MVKDRNPQSPTPLLNPKEDITIGEFQNFHYWYIIPISLLLITGLAFAMLGFSLDRVFNARLKDFR